MPSAMLFACHIALFLPLITINGGIQAIRSSSKIAESSKPLASESIDAPAPPLVSNPVCRLPKDRGGTNGCANGTGNGTKWYFDMDTMECLAFAFTGCGDGNANRFDTIFECKQTCPLPADYGGCAGRKPAANNAKGEQIICAGPGGDAQQTCPSGHVCRHTAFFGICCETKNEEIYARNYRPKCANGKHVHSLMDTQNNWPVVLLGKTCADAFCPDNMDCVGQEIFAHCCPK